MTSGNVVLWSKGITWLSTDNYLQPAYVDSSYINLILWINNSPYFLKINITDGSLSSSVYKFTESWSWASFIYIFSSKALISFQDSSTSYIKVYDQSNSFKSYSFSNGINLYGYSPITPDLSNLGK